MVTRKTRLMSLLLAILMVVSMLTAFVLPAVAAGSALEYDPSKGIYFTSTTDYNAPRGSQYTTYPSSNVYIVADDTDWRGLVAAANATNSAEGFAGDTIHFVADIDMKGVHVDPLSFDAKPVFKGTIDGHGKVFKNLLIDFSVSAANKYVALIGYSEGAVIQNLGIESGLIKARGSAGNTELMVASFVGESRYTGTFRNCWNAATIYAADAGNATVSGISRTYDNGASDSLMVDGCYNVGNVFANPTAISYAGGISGYNQQFGRAYNSFSHSILNANNTRGLIRYPGNPNAAYYGNSFLTLKGVELNAGGYKVLGDNASADETHLLSADAYSTGELAYKLNAGYTEGKGTRTYYTLKDGKTVFGDQNNQTLCVTVNKVAATTSTEYIYINKNETLTVPVYANYTCTTTEKEIVVTANTTLTYNLTGIDCAEAEAILAEIGDLDASLFTASAAIKAAQDAAKAAAAYAEIANPSETDKTNAAAAIADAKAKYEALSDWSMVGVPNYAERNLYAAWYTGKTYNIDSEADWLAAVEMGRGNDFSGITLNFTRDITFTQEIDPLCNVRLPFKGTIKGNNHVINNLKIDAKVYEDAYIGLIGYATNATVENLGIASGKITVSGANPKDEPMIGAFFGRGTGSTKVTHCWNAAEIYVDATGNGNISVSGIGRLQNGTTVDNCYNVGKLTSTQSNNVSGLNDWPEWNGHVYNSFAISTITNKSGSAGYLMRQKDWGDTPYQSQNPYPHNNTYAVGGLVFNNVYKNSKSDNPLVDEASFELAADVYTTGELAYMLNTGYTEGLGTKPYYTLVDNKTIFGTAANQTRKLTINLADSTGAVLLSEQKYVNAGTVYALELAGFEPVAEGLNGYNAEDGTFVMPAQDYTLTYKLANGAAGQKYVDAYTKYTVGHYAELFDLFKNEDKMRAAYAAAQSMVDNTAADLDAALKIVAENFIPVDELELKKAYPYYPEFSKFDAYRELNDKDSTGRIHWRISDATEWEHYTKNGFNPAAIMDSYPQYKDPSDTDSNTKIKNVDGNYVLILHVTNDIDFGGKVMSPVNFGSNFTIDGHGHVFKNIAVEKAVTGAANVGLLGDPWNAIIQNLGIEGGYVKATGTAANDKAVYVSTFGGYNGGYANRLYNCWSTADVINEVAGTDATKRIAAGLGIWQRETCRVLNGYYGGELKSTGNTAVVYYITAGMANNSKNTYGAGNMTFSNSKTAEADQANILAEDVLTNGELAYKLNAGYTAADFASYYPLEKKTYAVKNGVTTFGTLAPVQVTFHVDYESAEYEVETEGVADVTFLTDSNGNVLATEQQKAALNEAAAWGTAWTDVYTAETNTVKGTPYPKHLDSHVVRVQPNDDGVTHTEICEHSEGGVACRYQGSVGCVFDRNACVDPDASPDEAQHSVKCACGNVKEVVNCNTGDETQWIVTEDPATTEKEGSIKYECKVCGYTHTEPLEKLLAIKVDAEDGYAGETFEVAINLQSNPGVAGEVITVTYDPDAMSWDSWKAAMDINSDYVDVTVAKDPAGKELGEAKIALLHGANYEGEGLVTITFKVPDEVTAGDYDFEVSISASDFDGVMVPVEDYAGKIKIYDFIRGDVNDDKKVSIADAVLLLRMVNDDPNLTVAVNEKAADVDGNGTPAIADIIKLLQFLNGSIDTLEPTA